MTTPEEITHVRDAIHNPNDPRHFMQVVPAGSARTVRRGDVTLAESTNAVVVKEVGRDVYDPVVYFPRADVHMDRLVTIDTTTHCPLKGDTEYFDVVVDGERIPEAAWSYVHPIDEAEVLRDLVAFDTTKVSLS